MGSRLASFPYGDAHDGVFVGRQYAAFAGIITGRSARFVEKPGQDGWLGTALGAQQRARVLASNKPLYAAIGERAIATVSRFNRTSD